MSYFIEEHALFDVTLLTREQWQEEYRDKQRKYYRKNWKVKCIAGREKYRLKQLAAGRIVKPSYKSRYF